MLHVLIQYKVFPSELLCKDLHEKRGATVTWFDSPLPVAKLKFLKVFEVWWAAQNNLLPPQNKIIFLFVCLFVSLWVQWAKARWG